MFYIKVLNVIKAGFHSTRLINISKHYFKYAINNCSPWVEFYFNNTNLVTKLKVETFHSQSYMHITKQLFTSISVNARIYLPLCLGEHKKWMLRSY